MAPHTHTRQARRICLLESTLLSPDVVDLLFTHMETVHDVLAASRVCRLWRVCALDEHLWQRSFSENPALRGLEALVRERSSSKTFALALARGRTGELPTHLSPQSLVLLVRVGDSECLTTPLDTYGSSWHASCPVVLSASLPVGVESLARATALRVDVLRPADGVVVNLARDWSLDHSHVEDNGTGGGLQCQWTLDGLEADTLLNMSAEMYADRQVDWGTETTDFCPCLPCVLKSGVGDWHFDCEPIRLKFHARADNPTPLSMWGAGGVLETLNHVCDAAAAKRAALLQRTEASASSSTCCHARLLARPLFSDDTHILLCSLELVLASIARSSCADFLALVPKVAVLSSESRQITRSQSVWAELLRVHWPSIVAQSAPLHLSRVGLARELLGRPQLSPSLRESNVQLIVKVSGLEPVVSSFLPAVAALLAEHDDLDGHGVPPAPADQGEVLVDLSKALRGLSTESSSAFLYGARSAQPLGRGEQPQMQLRIDAIDKTTGQVLNIFDGAATYVVSFKEDGQANWLFTWRGGKSFFHPMCRVSASLLISDSGPPPLLAGSADEHGWNALAQEDPHLQALLDDENVRVACAQKTRPYDMIASQFASSSPRLRARSLKLKVSLCSPREQAALGGGYDTAPWLSSSSLPRAQLLQVLEQSFLAAQARSASQ
ncbi:hypothetical protein T492DRAFT_832254 [Pavlovales sp. CCMP2436]|nr:hypothetical protein T492DRAFT_832254 [Pavlovales sp. CCMP2436]